MPSKLKFFKNHEETTYYVFDELIATLQDDLHRMKTTERKSYTAQDRKELKNKIHDIEKLYGAVSDQLLEIKKHA